jgi:N-acyl-D-aspartate/D-glutamate deacylase
MTYDLLIKGGTVVDGSGLPRVQADVGINDGKITDIGKLTGAADEVIDAEGHVVAPGFIDAHTHMDAQVFWDPLGTCSCWHGVTSVMMGNCGFTLAPCAEENKHMVLRNLERAEDISPEAMAAGIEDWSWETFPEYLDAVDAAPKGINYGAYLGHSALRNYVMGERGFEEEASEDDLAAMKKVLREGLHAGAMGFSTSRSTNHRTADDKPVSSRLANWDEVCQLVGVMRDEGAGIFELTRESVTADEAAVRDYFDRIRDLAVDTKVPITFAGNYGRERGDFWLNFYNCADEIHERGGHALIQAHCRWACTLLSFESKLPYDRAPLWKELRARPLADQEAALRDPGMRAKLVAAALKHAKAPEEGVAAEVRSQVDYDWLFPLERMKPPYPSVADMAREQGKEPIDVVINMALDKNLHQFFMQPLFNEDWDVVLFMMRHPRTAVTFSDSGAPVSQIMDSSLHTHILSYWVREKGEFTLEQAIRKMTYDVASFWGLHDRGLVRNGKTADLVIFDPDTVAPQMPTLEHDLPGGAPRLKQKADGILATIVAGQTVIRNNEHTGALPGTVLRGPLAGAN